MTKKAMGIGLVSVCICGCVWRPPAPAGCDVVVTDPTRLQETVAAAQQGDVVYVPKGVYPLETPLCVSNRVSMLLHKDAVLWAVKPMDYVVKLDMRAQYDRKLMEKTFSGRDEDYNLFYIGGRIDANGLASCLYLENYRHFTMRDATFLNGRTYGLHVGYGYELIANNLYFKCVMPGLSGNTALYQPHGDSHFTDCVAVDYTIGVHAKGGANRFTRCHVWGGPIAEMLKGSVNFLIEAPNTFSCCYADTGETGFLVRTHPVDSTCLLSCYYFANNIFKLDHVTCIRHETGNLLVADSMFCKTSPNTKVYEGVKGCGKVVWRDCIYPWKWEPGDELPGDCMAEDR